MFKTRKSEGARHRFVAAGLVAAVLALSAAAAQASGETETTPEEGVEHPLVIAHRGGALLRPENTMPAFRHARDLGVDILEFDMEMTADDKIAVYHDATINAEFCSPDRGSDVTPGAVRSMTLAEIQQLDCGSGVRAMYDQADHVTVPGARVPTLDEVFREFGDSDIMFFPETKVPKSMAGVPDVDPVLFATRLNDAVTRYDLEDRVILQSFDFRTIDALHEINPRIRTCLLGADRLTDAYLGLLRKHHASCIVLDADDVGDAQLRDLQNAGILVFSGVVDKPQDWTRYIDLGFDAIFTNDPAGLINHLKSEVRKIRD